MDDVACAALLSITKKLQRRKRPKGGDLIRRVEYKIVHGRRHGTIMPCCKIKLRAEREVSLHLYVNSAQAQLEIWWHYQDMGPTLATLDLNDPACFNRLAGWLMTTTGCRWINF